MTIAPAVPLVSFGDHHILARCFCGLTLRYIRFREPFRRSAVCWINPQYLFEHRRRFSRKTLAIVSSRYGPKRLNRFLVETRSGIQITKNVHC